MVNYKKIQRMKEKRLNLKKLSFLSTKDVGDIRDVFFYPNSLTENNIQLLLVPFVAYNISFPIETTTFTLGIEEEKMFVIVGRLSRVFVPIRTNFRDTTTGKILRKLLRPEEASIKRELDKAMKIVCDDLETAPKTLWYNQISLVKTDLLDLKNLSNKFDNSIVIIENKMRADEDNKVLIRCIKLPISDDQNLQLMNELSDLKLAKTFS